MSNESKHDLSRFMPSREKMLEVADEAAAQKRRERTMARLRELQAQGLIETELPAEDGGVVAPTDVEAPVPHAPETPWAQGAAGTIDKKLLPSAAAPPVTRPVVSERGASGRARWSTTRKAVTVCVLVLVPVLLGIAAFLKPPRRDPNATSPHEAPTQRAAPPAATVPAAAPSEVAPASATVTPPGSAIEPPAAPTSSSSASPDPAPRPRHGAPPGVPSPPVAPASAEPSAPAPSATSVPAAPPASETAPGPFMVRPRDRTQ